MLSVVMLSVVMLSVVAPEEKIESINFNEIRTVRHKLLNIILRLKLCRRFIKCNLRPYA